MTFVTVYQCFFRYTECQFYSPIKRNTHRHIIDYHNVAENSAEEYCRQRKVDLTLILSQLTIDSSSQSRRKCYKMFFT